MTTETSTQPIEETARAYETDPAFLLINKAIADAHKLQKVGKTAEAIEKWRSIANIVEGTKDALAAHAWFTAGNLTAQLANTYCKLGHGKIKKAIAAYDNAIRLDPTHAEAYLHRGKVKNTLEHYEAALADLNEALRLKPATKSVQVAIYTARGVSKFGLGEHEAAFADHAEALRINPNCAEAYYHCGLAKMKQGKYECALTEFDEALRINPDMPEVYHNRGYANFFLSQFKAAIADYDQAIRLAPEQGASYSNRGLIKEVLGQREAALVDFEEAIRVDPAYAPSYSYRAKEKIRQNRDAEARADLEIALKLARTARDKQHQSFVESWLEELDVSEGDNRWLAAPGRTGSISNSHSNTTSN